MLVSYDDNTFIVVFDDEVQIAAQGRKALELYLLNIFLVIKISLKAI